MKINENLYQILVEEECTVPEHKLCRCQWGETSDGVETEIDSIGSHVTVKSGT